MDKEQIWENMIQVWLTECKSVQELSQKLCPETMTRIVRVIAGCKGRILTTGVGTSAAAARKIAHTFCCINFPSFFLSPADAVHGGLGAVTKDDIVIALSKGGVTQEILNMVPAIKRKGATLIGVTEDLHSPLARESDIVLQVKVEKEACPFNLLATSSTIAVIATFDAIAVALMYFTNYTCEEFAVIHPGGAVGQRLWKDYGKDAKEDVNESSNIQRS